MQPKSLLEWINGNNEDESVSFGMLAGDESDVNTVWLKPQLSLGDLQEIEKQAFRMEIEMQEARQSKNGRGRRSRKQQQSAGNVSVGVSNIAQVLAQAKVAVTDWEGPFFAGINCDMEGWKMISQAPAKAVEWWLEIISEKINELNEAQTAVPPVSTEPTTIDPN